MHPLEPKPPKTAAERFIDDFMRRIRGLEFTHEQAQAMKVEISVHDRLPRKGAA
jgi:hypothetical protein